MDYNAADIAKMIDHSVLKPEATTKDVEDGCLIALKYKTATVCVRPCDVSKARGFLLGSDVAVAVVVGFPHGTNTVEVKAYEAERAIQDGAAEIDVVMNYGRLLSGEFSYVENEIVTLTEAAHKRSAIIKVIFETCALSEELIIEACRMCNAASVDFVKTSTGFGARGATAGDVILMRKHADPKIQVKASGGIKTLNDVIEMKRLGATRIGASSTAVIMESFREL